MTYPTVHLNGTGADTLIEGYAEAAAKVREAIEAVNRIEFHRRDYYVQPSGAWEKAVEEHDNRLRKLREVRDELEEIALAVANQQDAKLRH